MDEHGPVDTRAAQAREGRRRQITPPLSPRHTFGVLMCLCHSHLMVPAELWGWAQGEQAQTGSPPLS